MPSKSPQNFVSSLAVKLFLFAPNKRWMALERSFGDLIDQWHLIFLYHLSKATLHSSSLLYASFAGRLVLVSNPFLESNETEIVGRSINEAILPQNLRRKGNLTNDMQQCKRV